MYMYMLIFIYIYMSKNCTSVCKFIHTLTKDVLLENFRVMDDCHGQHVHHLVNHTILSKHIIMSTTWDV